MEQANFLHIKELGGLELLKASYRQTHFSKHTHEGYCIGLIEEGAQAFYRTGKLHVAPKGNIILVNADEVHTGYSAVETGWRYRAIYPTPEMLAEISSDFFSSSHGAPWFSQAVVHDEGLVAQLSLLFDLLEQEDNILLKETLYLSTLAYLLQRHGQQRKTFSTLSDVQRKVLQIKQLMMDHPEGNYSLHDLAHMVELSPWHFLRQFKKHVGLAPHAWLIQARLNKARKLMKQGETIAWVAQHCGFSDQSHFNRHFKKTMGISPAQYIKDALL